jgi:hypothetical protein
MTDTQIRQKIILYIENRTNHIKVLSIDREPPPVHNAENKENNIWYSVEVETYNREKTRVFFQYHDNFINYAIKKNDKYHICDTKKVNQIF